MIFQAGIDLEIPGRNVQAVIDFDTGLIGFTETTDDNCREFYYRGSPKEFKLALFEKLEALFAENNQLNLKICRKNAEIEQLDRFFSERKPDQKN